VIADQPIARPETREPARARRVVGLAALIALALLGLWQLVSTVRTSPAYWHDFAQDYIAAEDVLAGRNPYRPQNERVGQLFNIPTPSEGPAYSFHPPTTIPFFLPLAPLPYPLAFAIWDVVQLACLWVVVDLTARALDRPLSPALGIVVALALVAVWPITQSFVEGQLNIPVAAGLVACWYALRARRPVLAGIALGLAVGLKPLAGLFVLWALWRRQWRLLVAAGATLVVLGLVGVTLAGVQGTIDYVTAAYPMHAELWPGYQDNASPQGLYTHLFGPSDWRPRPPYPTPGLSRALTLATWAVAVSLLFWRLGRRPPAAERLNRELAAVGATMLLVTPIIWPHYYAVLVAPIAIFATYHWQRRAWAWLALLAAALLLLWVPRDLHAWLERHALAPRAYGTMQLPGLLAVYLIGLACLGRPARPPVAEPDPEP
jgi:hypothetical protein